EALLLLLHADFEPQLDQYDSRIGDILLDLRAELQESMMLLLAHEPHDVFDTGPVVPAAVEDDDFAAGGEKIGITVHQHFRFLTSRRGGEGDHPEYARAHPLGECLDGAALAGGVASLEYDDDARLALPHPILQVAQLDLELAQLLLIILALHPAVVARVGRLG